MASANSWTVEIVSPVAAPRLFRAAAEGEGSVGSVRQFNFTSVTPFNSMKTVEFPDADKCEYTLIGSGGMETATFHVNVQPAADGGSVVNVEATHLKGRGLPSVKASDEDKAKESVTAIFKAAEAYLIANPNAYN